MNDVQIHIKRLFDIVVAVVCIVLFFPLFAICYMAVVLEDGRPAIFRQERIGLHGKPFIIYKLRSMKMDAEANGYELSNSEYDSRLTRVGRFLRSHHLDELPQLWNVLKGDMGVVGPRPPLPEEVAQYNQTYATRMLVKPGITGPWQVSDRSNLSKEESESLDVSYVQNWSMLGDIVLFFRTVGAVVTHKGAY